MFPTSISIIEIQSWWEVPSIAHFCSVFRTAFKLVDFDIEELEEALLTEGTGESSWVQDLIVKLLKGALPNKKASVSNYQKFLRRLFHQKCQEHDRYNPFDTDIDYQLLPLRTKVDILHALCDFRLDAKDVLDQLNNVEADSLRVEPLGYDSNESVYWYFYDTRLYREDFKIEDNKKKSVWQVICLTEDDWFQLTEKFKKSTSEVEKQLYHTLSENVLPKLLELFKEKENLARQRLLEKEERTKKLLLENEPELTSNRLSKLECEADNELAEGTEKERQLLDQQKPTKEEEEQIKKEKDKKELKKRRQEAYDRRTKLKEQSEEESCLSETSTERYEMAGHKSKKSKGRQRKVSYSSSSSKDNLNTSKKSKKYEGELESITKTESTKFFSQHDFDSENILDRLKNLETDSSRAKPLGYDTNESAYWYFYGTRLYREDFKTENTKQKSVWQVICCTEDDWFQLTEKFKKSTSEVEKQLYQTLSENVLPKLLRLFEKKKKPSKKLSLENLPKRISIQLRKLECEVKKELVEGTEKERQLLDLQKPTKEEEQIKKANDKKLKKRRQEGYDKNKIRRTM